MKKKTIFLLTILLMAIFVTSCSSDDDNEKTEFTSTLTVNGSAVKITNLEGKAIANSMFEFWVNDATSDFYIQGNIDYREELTTGKDVTKGCKMSIALVKLEEWYSSEKEYVSGTVTIEKWDLENVKRGNRTRHQGCGSPPFFLFTPVCQGGTNKSRQSAVSFRQQPDHCFGHLLFQGFEVQSVVCKC